MKRKIDSNQIFHFHEPTKEFAIEHIQDIQPLVDSNKNLQENDHLMRDELRLSARIPLTVYYEWKNKFGVDVFNFFVLFSLLSELASLFCPLLLT